MAKRVLRHMKGTLDFGLLYSPSKEIKLVGYSDSDWAGDTDDRKSDSGFVFYMGHIACMDIQESTNCDYMLLLPLVFVMQCGLEIC